MKFFKNNRGAAAVELALAALPVMLFILGIIQTAWILWVDNLLHVSVNTAARCTGVNSSTPPCTGHTLLQMKATATTVFAPLSGATFSNNPSCGGTGLIGTYHVSIVFVVNLTLTAKSCYPTVVVSS
jgi:Flp pilus assembly protein TadG